MKYLFLSLALFSSMTLRADERKNFSAIGAGDNSVFVSVKKFDAKNGTNSSLFEVSEQAKKEIKLTDTLKEREIVAIVSKNKRLFIVSQLTNEQGDNPIIFENIKNNWVKVKEVDCKAFSKIEVEKNNFTFFCEKEDKNTSKVTQFNQVVTIKNLNIDQKVIMPLQEISDKKITAKLEGIPFSWDKLKVQNIKSREYSVNEF